METQANTVSAKQWSGRIIGPSIRIEQADITYVYAQKIPQPGDAFKGWLFVGSYLTGALTMANLPDDLPVTSHSHQEGNVDLVITAAWKLAERCEGGWRVPFQGVIR